MKRTLIGDIIWLTILLIFTAFLVLPQTHQIFIQWTSTHPYLMGFIKFGLLATMGELLALRLANKTWKLPVGLIFKIAIWGLIGVLITFMFSFYSAGVSAMVAPLKISSGNQLLSKLFPAFLTSLIMNLTFGIVFMGMHRMSDTYIEMRYNHKKPSLKELIQSIQWDSFISFVVFKTIPLFWIPAHTITFALPSYYRVVAAAYLSIILGVILVYSNRAHKGTNSNEDVIREE
jgi:hypothetical protein